MTGLWRRRAWVGERLGVSNSTVSRLDACGILGLALMRGTQRSWHEGIIDELAALPSIEESSIPPALVVRMGEPAPSPLAWRACSGWSTTGPDRVRRDAARGDWRVILEEPEKFALVAVVGPVVVGAWQVTGVDPDGPTGDRRRYLVEDDADIAGTFLNHRWDLESGWTVGRRGI